MADDILLIDNAGIDAAGDAIARRYLRAGTQTIRVVTRRAEQRIERAVEQAAGGKLWRAVQSTVWPKADRPARNPVGEIWLKGRDRTHGAFDFFTKPGQIRKKGAGEWLPIPLKAAGKRNRLGILSPAEWERRNPGWILQLEWRDGKRPLLVAARKKGFSGRSQRGEEGKPIFMLVPNVAFRNSVAIEPLIKMANAEIGTEFARHT